MRTKRKIIQNKGKIVNGTFFLSLLRSYMTNKGLQRYKIQDYVLQDHKIQSRKIQD